MVPILFAVFFAILDYGVWFNNGQSVRQGAREGARQGVVQSFSDPACPSSTYTTNIAQLACKTDQSVGAINGTTYTKVVLPAGGWAQGSQLLVCSIVKSTSLTGLTPLPNGGSVSSATRMSIEVATPTPTGTSMAEGPASLNWTFCS